MKNETLPHEHEYQKFNSRLSKLGINPTISIADRHGIGFLAHASFDAAEGDHAPSPWLMLSLCTSHIGRMRRVGDGPTLDGILRPGTVAIALPNTAASGFWSKTQMLGIALNLSALAGSDEKLVMRDNLMAAASQLHNDALLTSVMTALWRNAEVHGLSGAFFEHGVDVLLKHLASFQIKQKLPSVALPLKGIHLQQVLDLMESRLGDDIRVIELAALVGQDSRTFTRSFQAATGYAPYAYFTLRRMEYAKRLLRDRQFGITDISLQVGYTNPSKFSGAFRRICGVTPSLWRQLENSH